MTERRRYQPTEHLLLLGAALWALAIILKWPTGLSFGDEVGYVGQMRLALQGRLQPLPGDLGVWVTTAHGTFAKYPYFIPLLIAPLFAVAPRLVFVTGLLAALALTFVTGRVLRAWNRNPLWALVVLLHPTVTIISRTMMTDLILAALSVGAWWAIRSDRRWLMVLLPALTVLTKAIGFVIVLGLLAGELVREREAWGRRDLTTIGRLCLVAVGLTVGLASTGLLNFLANGTVGFEYGDSVHYLTTPPFWPSYLLTSAPVHLVSLLAIPPLLIAGVWPYWRRREYGPLVVVVGLTSMMCFYFFVDRGRTFAETLLMSPRLILPAVAFLLIGYAECLDLLVAKLVPDRRWWAVAVPLPGLIALAISVRHRHWQSQDAAGLEAASAAIAAGGDDVLGLTYSASKAGMLYRGRTVLFESGIGPKFVLCSTQSPSYRVPDQVFNCTFPDYEEVSSRGSFHVLRRRTP
jgi:hypothetical protein